MDRVVKPLVDRLRSPDPAERAAACRDAATDPAGALHTDTLLRLLRDLDPQVGRAASVALVAIARAGSGDAIVPVLRRLMQDRTARVHAVLALARLVPPEPAFLPALVEALGAPDGDRRWAAAHALVDMGRLHPEVLQVVIGLLRDSTPPVRRMATFCLRELAPDLPAAASALIEASRDADAQVRRAALTAMAGLVEPPRSVIERLTEAAQEPDRIAAELAQLALDRLGAPDTDTVENR